MKNRDINHTTKKTNMVITNARLEFCVVINMISPMSFLGLRLINFGPPCCTVVCCILATLALTWTDQPSASSMQYAESEYICAIYCELN